MDENYDPKTARWARTIRDVLLALSGGYRGVIGAVGEQLAAELEEMLAELEGAD